MFSTLSPRRHCFDVKELETYVMDASAIDAPFLFSKLANHNRQTSGEDPSTPPAEAQRDCAAAAPVDGQATHPSGGSGLAAAAEDNDNGKQGPPAFDAVFSNAALHWVKAPRAVIEGVKRVLRPGGRCVQCVYVPLFCLVRVTHLTSPECMNLAYVRLAELDFGTPFSIGCRSISLYCILHSIKFRPV